MGKATPVHTKRKENTKNTSLIVKKGRAMLTPLFLSAIRVISFFLPLSALECFSLKLVLFVTKRLFLVKINFVYVSCFWNKRGEGNLPECKVNLARAHPCHAVKTPLNLSPDHDIFTVYEEG
jgi:hypothetical protein